MVYNRCYCVLELRFLDLELVCIFRSVEMGHPRLRLMGNERRDEAALSENVSLLPDEGALAGLELVAGLVHHFWLL